MEHRTEIYKMHTFTWSELELEELLQEPDELIRQIRRAKLNGLTPPEARKGSERKRIQIAMTKKAHARARRQSPEENILCPKCGLPVKPNGLLIHQQGARCKRLQQRQALQVVSTE